MKIPGTPDNPHRSAEKGAAAYLIVHRIFESLNINQQMQVRDALRVDIEWIKEYNKTRTESDGVRNDHLIKLLKDI